MQWHQTHRSNGTNRFTDQCLPISWIKHTMEACVIISAAVKQRQRCNSRWIYRIKSSILAEARDFVATEFNRSTRSSISIFFLSSNVSFVIPLLAISNIRFTTVKYTISCKIYFHFVFILQFIILV